MKRITLALSLCIVPALLAGCRSDDDHEHAEEAAEQATEQPAAQPAVPPADEGESQAGAGEPKAAPVAFLGNAECPMSGKDVDRAVYLEHGGERVYFCCSKCSGKGEAEAEKWIAAAYPETTAIENTTCPVSGEPIEDGAATVKWQGHELSLCCPACQKSFAADPAGTAARALADSGSGK